MQDHGPISFSIFRLLAQTLDKVHRCDRLNRLRQLFTSWEMLLNFLLKTKYLLNSVITEQRILNILKYVGVVIV